MGLFNPHDDNYIRKYIPLSLRIRRWDQQQKGESMRKIKNLLPIGLCLSMCVASLPGNLTLSTARAHAANESQSKNLNEYELCWKLLEDDKVIDQGTLDASLAAGSETDLTVPYTMPTQVKEGAEYHLNLSVCLKEDTDYLKKGSSHSQPWILPRLLHRKRSGVYRYYTSLLRRQPASIGYFRLMPAASC